MTRAPNASEPLPPGVDEFEYTRCWDETESVFVKIVDVCPCRYSWGTQRVCCGPVPHFDLSFWAHEKLAHPIQVRSIQTNVFHPPLGFNT